MAPIETPATILSTIPYGETSKIARLATRELGVVSVIAKGARRPRSAFGASLQILSDGIATVHLARHSDLHTLSAFDVGRVPEAMATNIERYAVATVLGELMLRFAPGDRQAATYDFFRHGLDVLEGSPPRSWRSSGSARSGDSSLISALRPHWACAPVTACRWAGIRGRSPSRRPMAGYCARPVPVRSKPAV